MAPSALLNKIQQQQLLNTAAASIDYGLQHHQPMPSGMITTKDPMLLANGASFVTLTRAGQLRGCIGSLEAFQPLIKDVIAHAYDAAFNDHRFPPLSIGEREDLHWHISVLSAPEPIDSISEADLLKQLRPHIDGVIIQDQGYRATFLPQVWEDLPTPQTFLHHLKRKAGLLPNHWSKTLEVFRYTVQAF